MANEFDLATILHLCPSIKGLSDTLKTRQLDDNHLSIATSVCKELAVNVSQLPDFKGVEEIPGFMNRILIYEDEHLDIRGHLFIKGHEESILHDHQHSFISLCLQGSYMHHRYSVTEDKDSKHYVCKRTSGGKFSPPKEVPGKLTHKRSDPFKQGSSYFLSSAEYHTVEANSEVPVMTIVFKDKRQMKPCSTFRDFDLKKLEEFRLSQPGTKKIQDAQVKTQLNMQFKQALANYCTLQSA